jgi:hypothetical protein
MGYQGLTGEAGVCGRECGFERCILSPVCLPFSHFLTAMSEQLYCAIFSRHHNILPHHKPTASQPQTKISETMLQNQSFLVGCWRLTPVILATQEAEIRMIEVQSHPGQIVWETLSRKNPSQSRDGWVAQGVGPKNLSSLKLSILGILS